MAKRKVDEPMPIMRFRIVSTGCEIELTRLKRTMNGERIARPIYEFKYTNRTDNPANDYMDKPNFTTYVEEIDKAVKMERWIKI